ncbi:MAG: M6 family metalloprotease domain-containing protein, partial [Bacteroidota bacterium]
MKNKLRILTLCLFIIAQFSFLREEVKAVTAYPYPIEFKQPDGSILTILLKGDEKVRWALTSDGYTIIFNSSGTYEYAKLNNYGEMVPSGIKANNFERREVEELNFLIQTPKALFYSETQVSAMKQIWEIYENEAKGAKAFPTTGNRKLICILMNYTDKTFVRTRLEFDNLFNQITYNFDGATGSVKDYFLENSYNQFNLTVTVVGPYTAANNMAYYGANVSGDDVNPRALITEAVNLANSDVNYADFDNDNDGSVDGVYVIYAGYDESAGGPADAIWAHAWSIATVVLDGKSISKYSCSSELRSNSGTGITRIGVVCHEFGHVLGAPDFYDTDYATGGQFSGTGYWDLQASGSWNNSGTTPAHSNGYTKTILYGWATQNLLTQGQDVTLYNAAQNKTSFYRFNTATANEYYLCENRQLVGFDGYLPGHGMIIYHVNATVGTVDINTTHPQKMYPVCASATSQQPTATPSTYGVINGGGCPYPGTASKTSFTDNTTPWARSWASALTNKPVENITEITLNKTITFRFMGGPTCSLPTIQAANFSATAITTNSMTANWTRGDGNTVLVVARATGEVNSDPVIGTSYTASAIFGSGSQIGYGNYVVYKGTGTSVNVTNLASGTVYYYGIYEFNSADNCYKSPGLTGNDTTTYIPVPPVSEFTSNLTTISAGQSIEFTETCTSNPETWSWTFDGGFPSTSTDRTPEVTWVTPGTYTVSLMASNQFGSDTEIKTNYITVNSLISLPPTNPVIIGTGTNSGTYWPLGISTLGAASYRYVRDAAIYTNTEIGGGGQLTKIEWRPGTSRADVRNIQIYVKHTTDATFTANPVGSYTSGATLVYSGPFTPNVAGWFAFNLTDVFIYDGTSNLMVIAMVNTTGSPGSAGSNCYYTTAASKHQQWNGSSAPAGNGTVNGNRPNVRLTFSTPTPPVANFAGLDYILKEDFESGTFPPTGWTINNVDGAGTTWATSTIQNHSFGGGNSARHVYGVAGYNENGYFITPQITSLPAGAVLNFWSYNEWPTYYGTNSVLLSTTTNAPAAFTVNLYQPASVTASWVSTQIDLSAYAGQNIYIAFRYQGNDAHTWYIDDVDVSTYNYTQIDTYEGDPLTIYDMSTGGPFVWEWTNSGATPIVSGTQNVTTTYNVAGLYPVSLKAGNYGGTNTKTVPNFVNVIGRAPIANYYGKGNLKTDAFQPFIPSGGTVTFSNKSTRVPTSWNWSFSNGSPLSSTAQTPPVITYNATGTHDVSLTVSNAFGNNNKTEAYVNVMGTYFVTNLIESDLLTGYGYTAGQLPGHAADAADLSGGEFYKYAEFYDNSYPGIVTAVDIAVRYAQGTGKNINVTVWNGVDGVPGTILGTKTVAISSFTETAWNTVTFDTPINVTGDFFIGYELNYDVGHDFVTHQFRPYMALDRGESATESSAWFMYGSNLASAAWESFDVGFGGFKTALAVHPEFTYASFVPVADFSATPTTLCAGGSTSFTDLSTGSPDSWAWTFPGGTPATSTDQNPTISYATAGTYDVTLTATNASGSDGETKTSYITVNPLPIAPTSVSATLTTICAGSSSILSYTGGSGTTFGWYSASCGGTSVGTGNNLSVTPAITTTYYGRWENGCGNSTCQTVTITVNPLPVAPTSVSATLTTICAGSSTVLSYTGGSGTTFGWYTGSCGGTSVGTGNNLSVTPAITTTYYGRWENACGNSTCQTITITVNPLPVAPTSVSATLTTICSGASTILSYTGGSGTTFGWYTASCGGASVGTGNNLSVSPAVTTTYYGRWENACGNSTCQTITITVNPLPVAPTSVSATLTTICSGASTVLSYTGGSGTTFGWYTASCGGASVGTGNNLSVSPAVTTTYYGRWENACG